MAEVHTAQQPQSTRPSQGRLAVVTGGARGIGAAIVRALAADGHRVVIGYRTSGATAEAVVEELAAEGHEAFAMALDVRAPESVDCFATAVENRAGPPEVLVNNAGWKLDQLLFDSDPSDWLNTMMVNVYGAYLLTRRFARHMVSQRWGRIINVSSGAGSMGSPAQSAYCASKAALNGMTRALARELGRRRVLVNAVAPGLVPTEMTKQLLVAQREAFTKLTPLSRPGTAAEIAAVVGFLASDAASYVNGQVIAIDGGLSS